MTIELDRMRFQLYIAVQQLIESGSNLERQLSAVQHALHERVGRRLEIRLCPELRSQKPSGAFLVQVRP